MQIIDLTVPLNEQTPVYPGDPAAVIKPAGVFEKDSYNDHRISMGTHVGTHIDAPFHMLAEGKTLDTFPIDYFVGRGRYIKVNGAFDLTTIQKADIQSGDIVLFHTGMSDCYGEPRYYEEYPEMPVEVAEYLVKKGVNMVGFDACGPDYEPFKTHKVLLGGDVLIVENLTSLAQLADKDFTVYALPINLQLDGAPARVIAQIN